MLAIVMRDNMAFYYSCVFKSLEMDNTIKVVDKRTANEAARQGDTLWQMQPMNMALELAPDAWVQLDDVEKALVGPVASGRWRYCLRYCLSRTVRRTLAEILVFRYERFAEIWLHGGPQSGVGWLPAPAIPRAE
jgi:hypothetical protein